MSDLLKLGQDWDQAARQDAFGNILTIPGMTPEQFWESGQREITDLLDDLGLDRCEKALDFGCGIGRLTRPLADHFTEALGVDISSEMVRLARFFDKRPTYHVNRAAKLPCQTNSFDLVYSSIVLQHMPTELAGRYVREFLRVSRDRVVFQVPEGPTNENGALSMYGTPRETVEGWLVGLDFEVTQNEAAGATFTSYRYEVAL